MEKSKYKMIHLSGEAGQECAELIEEIKTMIRVDEKRKVYNTELVLRGLRVLKGLLLFGKETQSTLNTNFGQTNIIE